MIDLFEDDITSDVVFLKVSQKLLLENFPVEVSHIRTELGDVSVVCRFVNSQGYEICTLQAVQYESEDFFTQDINAARGRPGRQRNSLHRVHSSGLYFIVC